MLVRLDDIARRALNYRNIIGAGIKRI